VGARPLPLDPLIGAGLALLALAGCSPEQQLDTAEAERSIARRLATESGQPINVQCPNDVELAQGETFDCTARGRGERRITVRVQQLDDEGSVRYRVVPGPPREHD
jgi:hypothetical protein